MIVSPLLWASAVGRLSTVATQLVVGYFLTPGQFGEFAVASALCNFLSLFQSGDLSRLALQSAVSKTPSAAETRSLLLVGCLLTGSAILGIALLSLGKINPWFAGCLVLLPFLRVMANTRVTLLSSVRATDKLAIVSSVEAITRSSVSISLAIAGLGGWSLIIGEVFAVMASLLTLAWFCAGPRDALILRLDCLPSVGMVVLSSFLNLVERELPVFAVGYALNSTEAGSYAFAYRIATQLVIVMVPMIALETIPRLIAARADWTSFELTRVAERRRLTQICAGLVFLLAVCAPLAIYLLWGARWIDAVQILPVLVVATAFRIGYLFNRAVLEARGQFRTIFSISVLDAAFIVAATLAALLLGGTVLLALALLAEVLVVLWISRAVTLKVLAARS